MSGGSVDPLKRPRSLVRWQRLDPELPGGLHEPKLEGDVGWDLEAMEDRWIGPMESCDVPVNARLWLPDGWYADIRNRSSMARRSLYIDQNVIDTGYRGPLFVFVRNMRLPYDGAWDPLEGGDPNGITVSAGERIGQLIFHRFNPVWATEVAEVPLDSKRAEAGMGSTGR